MKNILSSATIATFFTCAYNSPVVTILAVIIALFVASIVAELLTARNAQDAEFDQHYAELKDAFDDVFASDIINTPVYQEDLWTTTEPNTCELTCGINPTVRPVLALPPCTCIDYTMYSYKQLQQLCRKRRRKPSDIKLNAKRAVLEAFLMANS